MRILIYLLAISLRRNLIGLAENFAKIAGFEELNYAQYWQYSSHYGKAILLR